MKRAIALLLAAMLGVAPAHAAQILPFSGATVAGPADDDEKRVWGQGEEFDDMLRKSGRLLDDPDLTRYLQGVMDRLYPEFQGRIRVRVVRSPQLNAFALPHGSIYVNSGLLARFENEAQLATVLAHEGIHFVNRHGYQHQQNIRSTSAFATALAMIGIPVVGLVANVLATSSIFGFSRELETEADNEGYRRVVAAGYDPRETPRAFGHLIRELKASGIDEPFFFSSHPRLQERFDNFQRLSAEGAPPPDAKPDMYGPLTASLRLRNLEQELSMGRYRQVVAVLTDEEQRGLYPPHLDYYLGEAYRLRGEPGDPERALEAYGRAAANAPSFAPVHRALGIHFLKQGAYGDAQRELERYLALVPQASDRAWVEQYIELTRQRGGQP